MIVVLLLVQVYLPIIITVLVLTQPLALHPHILLGEIMDFLGYLVLGNA